MPTSNPEAERVAKAVVNAFYGVYNYLGHGFLEKVYENALALELRHQRFEVVQQAPMAVYYHGEVVGSYFADLLVNGLVILELKTVEKLASEHEAQLINYLRATDISIGLLLNFGPNAQVKRKVYETARIR